ncbi:MAG TPA: NADH-ubiquinone oxidoreductase-F iron-sulfur binding region domain-containing protein [Solirubrobacteraceae bacterium]|nr:NADH-ubiquinone oxidoreductase-F iron-sulfur binding region domain-containing protein [Solirubrobacteraceae bacterium]
MSARLLAGLSGRDPLSLERHVELHGPPPSLERERLLRELEAAGLRGRGGAGFPSAVKAHNLGRRRPVLVVNGAESEPMGMKDRVLLTRTPHLVLDGAQAAAHALAVREIVLVAPQGSLPLVAAALRERRALGRAPAEVELRAAAPGYVAGEESALLAHLEGRPAKPRVKPPLPVERGLQGRPTLVHNAETLAHLALIARYGAAWFRERGTQEQPGTTLVTVAGAVQAPGVYEIDLGTPLARVLETAGGPLEELRALLVGGYFGAWLDASDAHVQLADIALRPLGATVGAGIVFALGATACGVAETARLARWMAGESAGQCGPCANGLPALADLLERQATGRAVQGDADRLQRWLWMVQRRGACHHPDGTARMIASATRVFAQELSDHARRGPCRACSVQALRLPRAGAAKAA